MLKIKIKKILPFWLLSIALVALLQISAAVTFNHATASQTGAAKVLGASTIAVRGASLPDPAQKVKKTSDPDLSSISAKSFLAFDLHTGETLLEKNPDSMLGIASLTKLITALAIYKNINLNEAAVISQKGILNTSPVLGLKAGDKVKVMDLFYAMLVGSANDAAQTLAEYAENKTGKKIAELMNREAEALGMSDSLFSNPLGFDSANNYSTASDLKKLITETQKLSAFANVGRRNQYSFISDSGVHYKIPATNRLLREIPNLYAIKTGFTERSGGSMATKIIIGKSKIGLVVLGSANRENDTLVLTKALETSFAWK